MSERKDTVLLSARAEFYRKLLPFPRLTPVIDTDTTYYCVGGRTVIDISAPSAEHEGATFQKTASACTICVSAPESGPTSMRCTASCSRSA